MNWKQFTKKRPWREDHRFCS